MEVRPRPHAGIRIFLRTEIFFPVFRKIRIHTWRMRIGFARPHKNAKTMDMR